MLHRYSQQVGFLHRFTLTLQDFGQQKSRSMRLYGESFLRHRALAVANTEYYIRGLKICEWKTQDKYRQHMTKASRPCNPGAASRFVSNGKLRNGVDDSQSRIRSSSAAL